MVGLVQSLDVWRNTPTGASSPRGNRAPDWAKVGTIDGLVQEQDGQEIDLPNLGGTVVANYIIFADASQAAAVALTPRDQLRSGGSTFQLFFTPDVSFLGHHLEINARAVS